MYRNSVINTNVSLSLFFFFSPPCKCLNLQDKKVSTVFLSFLKKIFSPEIIYESRTCKLRINQYYKTSTKHFLFASPLPQFIPEYLGPQSQLVSILHITIYMYQLYIELIVTDHIYVYQFGLTSIFLSVILLAVVDLNC